MAYATEEERQQAQREYEMRRRAERYSEEHRVTGRYEPSPEALADRDLRLSWPRTEAEIHCGDPPFPQCALAKKQLQQEKVSEEKD